MSFSSAPTAIWFTRNLQTESFEKTIPNIHRSHICEIILQILDKSDKVIHGWVMRTEAVVSISSPNPQPASFMSSILNVVTASDSQRKLYLRAGNPAFATIRRADWPHRAEPRLWCGVYSRPTTKTAFLPSVVLIKKTAHVEIKQQQQAVCIFRGARVHEWGQKSAFLEWKNPPTGFSKLLHLFADWLCSPDSLVVFFSHCIISVRAVYSPAHGRTSLMKKWRRRAIFWNCWRTDKKKKKWEVGSPQTSIHFCAL